MNDMKPLKHRPPDAALLEQLKSVVGPKGWLDLPADLAPQLVDWRRRYQGETPLLVRPASTAEVADVVRLCAEAGVAIVPQGGNTGLCGGIDPVRAGDEILLSLSRMNRVRAIDAANYTITAEAGCILAQVQEAAQPGRPAVSLEPRRPRAAARSAAISRPMPAASPCCAMAMPAIWCWASKWCCRTAQVWDGLRGTAQGQYRL